ncbi:hypothetical protein ABOM_005741 [Aspergillus bombycis]|uniref:Uncharacterized protein n=1 Tax=Aspergillus bombycis TaxID=109264 RepID=A0A1F8A0Z4_9EURO|nr:hypothetical protein ABOM_005741 [Aspergillus bombycis]OGM45005.1 hypothetical protein ABOM_005741 [Aspergillus bombycis]
MPGQQRMPMGMTDATQQAARHQQQQPPPQAEQRPGSSIPLADDLSTLSAGDYDYVCSIADQLQAQTSQEDMERIKKKLGNMTPEQRKYLESKNMDPLTFFFRSYALSQWRRHRQASINAQSAQNIEVDLNNPPASISSIENVQGQQTDATRSQEAGPPMVPPRVGISRRATKQEAGTDPVTAAATPVARLLSQFSQRPTSPASHHYVPSTNLTTSAANLSGSTHGKGDTEETKSASSLEAITKDPWAFSAFLAEETEDMCIGLDIEDNNNLAFSGTNALPVTAATDSGYVSLPRRSYGSPFKRKRQHKDSRNPANETYSSENSEHQYHGTEIADDLECAESADDAIERAITITGSIKDAQAMATVQYLCQTWPSTGIHLLRLVKDVVRGGPNCTFHCILLDKTQISACLDKAVFEIEVMGIAECIAEIGEQLGWLGAALRTSPYEAGVVLCRPVVSKLTTERGSTNLARESLSLPYCHINFIIDSHVDGGELLNGQCWHRLFRNPARVKAIPYPIDSSSKQALKYHST